MAKKGRGTRTHGHGTRKRGSGRRGGRGYAGVKDSKWIKTIKGGKVKMGITKRRGKVGHFGKHGFTRGGLDAKVSTVNVNWLEGFSEGDTVKLEEHGVDKLLGAGKLTKKLKVIAPKWSARAEQKIKAAGGTISTGEQE